VHAWIFVGRHADRFAIQTGRRQRLACLGVGRGRVAGAGIELRFLAAVAGLLRYQGEECGELGVVGLAPLFVWVVVATGALDPLAEEQLRGVFGPLFQVGDLGEPIDGRVIGGGTGRGQQFADELVVGFVVDQALANPVMERHVGELQRPTVAAVAEDRSPLAGEVLRVVFTIEQAIDDAISLLTARGRVVGELLNFVQGREAAGDVEGESAEKGGVVAIG